jgi:hypothetical protein
MCRIGALLVALVVLLQPAGGVNVVSCPRCAEHCPMKTPRLPCHEANSPMPCHDGSGARWVAGCAHSSGALPATPVRAVLPPIRDAALSLASSPVSDEPVHTPPPVFLEPPTDPPRTFLAVV